MTLINKLTNIANSIREKTGDNSPLTLDEMANKIQNINTNNTNNINILDKWYAYNFGLHANDYTVYDCVYLHKDYVTSPPQYSTTVTPYKYTDNGFVIDTNTTSDYGVYMQSNGVLFYHGAGYGHIPELDIITYSPQQTLPASK